jgi:peptide/nickel transport system permease protein
MVAYIARRLISLLVLWFLVVTFVFLLVHLIPGDPASIIAGVGATEEAVENIREELGLDRPLYVQYLEKMRGLLVGDMGSSMMTDTPVTELVWNRFGATLELVLVGALVSVIFGIPLGMIAARNFNTIWDSAINAVATLLISLPVFVVGTFLIYIFAMQLNILPSSGQVALLEDPIGHFKRVIMPGVTLGLALTTVNVRMMRSSLVEILDKNFMRAALAKGLSQNQLFWRHGVRNALIPVLTVFGVQLGYLFGGSVVVEQVFNYPGLNSLLINAIHRRDYPVVEGAMILITGAYFLINLIVDVLYVVIDPRVGYE